MKKRLLFAFMAICASVSSFALSQGDFVYTPQGRFQITGANVNANNAFQTMDGWTAIGEGKTLADLFNTNADGYAAGFNSVQSTAATAGEGMYFKFEPTDASAAYVVSFKMKGAALDNIRVRIPGDGYKTEANLVKVAGNDANAYTHPATEGEVIANTAEELNENWQTFNYAIVGDGTARTWFISLTAMATTIEIADLQIAPALQFADLRQRDAMLEKLNTFKNCYTWSEDLLNEYAMNEAIANLEAIGDESGQAELDEQIATAQEILDEFVNVNMDDYLPTVEVTATTNGAGTPKVDVKFSQWFAKVQKAYTWGDWQCLPSGRGFWENASQGAADFGHYAGNSAWNYGDVEGPMGIYMNKTLDAGSYVFGIESAAALREDATSSSWTNNEGWDVAYGVAYIVKVENEVTTDTVASLVKNLDAVNYTTFSIPATITESGTYEIGFKAYCKDGYKELKNGSVLYIKNASIWGKNNNKYNQKQLGYEADVREQIQAGRNNITTAIENIDNAKYFWGKAELQACVDTVETKIAAYELLDQDGIIDTYEDDYAKSTSEETGYLVYTVYQEAVKDIIAANKKFLAVNDTLASMQTAIDNAEVVKGMRLYDAATGKADLQAAIDKAKGIQATMKATDYSQENAAAIVAANAELAEAVEAFKTSVPASEIATLVDIDFENDAVLNEETQLYSIAGAAGSMEFSKWSTDGTGDQPFEKGFWSNGEQLWKGYVRIGNGTGTVVFDPTVDGSMGTNILKVACDLYVQGLSGRSLGFFLKNVVEGESGSEDANIFGLFHNFYNGTTETNTCNVDISKIWAKSGGSYNNASPADAVDTVTANPLQKSHIEVIMDYGKKTMYCTISSINGETTSEEVALEAVPTKFVLQCNYNNNDRRAWFDNLLIQRINAGEYVPEGPVLADFEDGKYYLVNVSSEKSWGAGNNWGTQASLVKHPEYVTLHKQADGTYFMESQVSNGGESYYFGGEYMDGSPVALTITQGEVIGQDDDDNDIYGYYVTADSINYYGWDGTENTVLARNLAAGDEKALWLIIPEAQAIAELADATAEDPVDATFLILDADFGRNNRNASAWTGDGFSVPNSNVQYYNAEKWGGNSQTFDIVQTIDVPNGSYKISWYGFYRYNNTTDNTNDIAIAAHADGTEVINSFVYINGKDYPLTSIADDAASAALEGKIPFSQQEAGAAFAQGLYQQSDKIVVTDGKLTIGIKKIEHPGCDWTVWDNFELEYYGVADEPVVVETVKTVNMQDGAIYNLAGQKVGADYKGIVIINGKKILEK